MCVFVLRTCSAPQKWYAYWFWILWHWSWIQSQLHCISWRWWYASRWSPSLFVNNYSATTSRWLWFSREVPSSQLPEWHNSFSFQWQSNNWSFTLYCCTELLRMAYLSKIADDSFAIYSLDTVSLHNARLLIVPHALSLVRVFNLRAKCPLQPSALWLPLRQNNDLMMIYCTFYKTLESLPIFDPKICVDK